MKALKKVKARKEKLNQVKEELASSGEKEVNLTDKEAKKMKMSEGKVKAGYNIQLASENQIIQDYEISNQACDVNEGMHTLEGVEKNTGQKIKEANLDAGYSSEDNLQYCKDNKINARIPDAKAYRLEKGELDKFDRENFKYHKEKEMYICPARKGLEMKRREKKRGKEVLRYEAKKENCQRCLYRQQCIKGNKATKRSIVVNPQREKLVQDMREKLKAEKEEYQKRMSDVEPVFGNIKHNRGIR
jgi:transposase